MRAEGFPAEVALEGLLAGVGAKVHVEIGFLGEGVLAESTHVRPFVPGKTGSAVREDGGVPSKPKLVPAWRATPPPSPPPPPRHLCFALTCICKPFRLDARWPHSSQTNSFSPRCLKASCRFSSVRERKHLEQEEH